MADTDVSNVTSNFKGSGVLQIEDVLHGTIQNYITWGRNVHLLWYLLGFIGNAISIKIWTLPQMYEICSYAMYLTAISVCDIVCLVLHMFYYVSFFWNMKSLQDTTLCETWTIVYMIPQYIGLFLVTGFITQKLMAISDPFLSNRYLPRQNAAKQIVGIVVFVTTLSFPLAYLWKTEDRGDCERNDQEQIGASSEDTKQTYDSQYILLYWLTDIGTYVPLITLVLSICIIIKSRKSNESQPLAKAVRRDSQVAKTKSYFHQSTVILLSLSFFRILTYLPNTVLLILRRLGYVDPSKLPRVHSIPEAMRSEPWILYTRYASTKICCDIVENSHLALGVFIYILSSRHYRKEILIGAAKLMTVSRDIYKYCVSVSNSIKCKLTETI